MKKSKLMFAAVMAMLMFVSVGVLAGCSPAPIAKTDATTTYTLNVGDSLELSVLDFIDLNGAEDVTYSATAGDAKITVSDVASNKFTVTGVAESDSSTVTLKAIQSSKDKVSVVLTFKVEKESFAVAIKNYATCAVTNNAASVKDGEDYTFTAKPNIEEAIDSRLADYKITTDLVVTATVGGTEKTVTAGANNSYTVAGVNGPVELTIKEKITSDKLVDVIKDPTGGTQASPTYTDRKFWDVADASSWNRASILNSLTGDNTLTKPTLTGTDQLTFTGKAVFEMFRIPAFGTAVGDNPVATVAALGVPTGAADPVTVIDKAQFQYSFAMKASAGFKMLFFANATTVLGETASTNKLAGSWVRFGLDDGKFQFTHSSICQEKGTPDFAETSLATAVAADAGYKVDDWNRFDFVISRDANIATARIYINGIKVNFAGVAANLSAESTTKISGAAVDSVGNFTFKANTSGTVTPKSGYGNGNNVQVGAGGQRFIVWADTANPITIGKLNYAS